MYLFILTNLDIINIIHNFCYLTFFYEFPFLNFFESEYWNVINIFLRVYYEQINFLCHQPNICILKYEPKKEQLSKIFTRPCR